MCVYGVCAWCACVCVCAYAYACIFLLYILNASLSISVQSLLSYFIFLHGKRAFLDRK